jgi:hypothetical protein
VFGKLEENAESHDEQKIPSVLQAGESHCSFKVMGVVAFRDPGADEVGGTKHATWENWKRTTRVFLSGG